MMANTGGEAGLYRLVEEMRKHKAVFFSVPFDLTQETFIVRFA